MLIRPDPARTIGGALGANFSPVDVKAILSSVNITLIERRFFFRREIQRFQISLSELSEILGVARDADFGTRSAKTIDGFGSPSGPVSTHRAN